MNIENFEFNIFNSVVNYKFNADSDYSFEYDIKYHYAKYDYE